MPRLVLVDNLHYPTTQKLLQTQIQQRMWTTMMAFSSCHLELQSSLACLPSFQCKKWKLQWEYNKVTYISWKWWTFFFEWEWKKNMFHIFDVPSALSLSHTWHSQFKEITFRLIEMPFYIGLSVWFPSHLFFRSSSKCTNPPCTFHTKMTLWTQVGWEILTGSEGSRELLGLRLDISPVQCLHFYAMMAIMGHYRR